MPSKKSKCSHGVAALIVGLEGCGKTTLIKQLRNYSLTGAALPSHAVQATPTAGMELDTWQHESTRIKVKDVGGAFVGTWTKYLKGIDVLLYMVDLSNAAQLGSSCIELFHLLSDPIISQKPVLVLLSKGDMPAVFDAATFRQLSQVDSIRLHHPNLSLEVIEVTAFTGTNISQLLSWLLDHRRLLTTDD